MTISIYTDFSQYATRDGGPYAGDQNDLDFGGLPIVKSPHGICTLYTNDDVTQFYVNRGAGTGDHDLVPLYNDYYNAAGALLTAAVAAVEAWCDVYVPDDDFAGIIVLDVERPPRWYWLGAGDRTDWADDTFDAAGETEYNAFFKLVVEAIVAKIRLLRPNARIGWYDLPYYAHTGSDYYIQAVKDEHDLLGWLWTLMDVMLPSTGYLKALGDSESDSYETGHVTPEFNEDFIRSCITETKRTLAATSISRPIYLYTWCLYSNGDVPEIDQDPLIEADFQLVVDVSVEENIDGMIFWQGFGPDATSTSVAVAKYEVFLPDIFIPILGEVYFGDGEGGSRRDRSRR